MVQDDEILEIAARDGSFDKSRWPSFLEDLLPRLDHIVYNDFDMPTVPPSEGPQHFMTASMQSGRLAAAVTDDSSLHEPESRPSAAPGPPTDVVASHRPTSPAIIPDSQPSDSAATQKSFPPQLESLFLNIKANLKNSFDTAPPFTIQRLAELILRPSYHYRTLPSYLRALDRIVCVSSTADTFPLPSISLAESESGGSSILTSSTSRALADDFNGAALTRIPWLRDTASMMMSSDRPLTSDLRTESTSLIDGPNGAGSVETVTVSVNGFSGMSRSDGQHRSESSGPITSEGEETRPNENHGQQHLGQDDDTEEAPHARGPDEIGSADIGPQADRVNHVFDAEAAIGRPGEAETVRSTIVSRDGKDDKDDGVVEEVQTHPVRDTNVDLLGPNVVNTLDNREDEIP